jgi:hypothetical protein
MKPPSRPATTMSILPWLPVLILLGCAPTHVETMREYTGATPLAKPDRVIVHDLAFSPKDVSPNSGIGAKLADMATGASLTDQQLEIGRAASDAFADELVKAIRDLGLPAERASGAPVITERTLAIEGQFLSLDEGNRARRLVIGFGAGASEVRTHIQVYHGKGAARQFVQEFETSAGSSKKPGMGPMAGVGAVATTAATGAAVSGGVSAVTESNQEVRGEARRTAKEVAKPLSRFFVGQGWIAPEMVLK